MYKHFKIASLAMLLFGLTKVAAQELTPADGLQGQINDYHLDNNQPGIITDRPDATESPNTVEPGFIQIETGGYYTRFEEKIGRAHV